MPFHLLSGKPLTLTERLTALAGAGGSLAAQGYGLWLAYLGYTHHGPVAAQYWPRPYLVLGLLLALLTLLYLVPRWRRQRRQWVLTSQGVAFTPKGPRIPWEQIQGMIVALTPSHGQITLLTAARRWRLDAHPEALRQALPYLEARLYPLWAARWRARWQQGQGIALGPWQVTPAGIQTQGQFLPWSAIRRLGIRQGRLVIELEQRAVTIPVARVPNAVLFVRWLHQEGHV